MGITIAPVRPNKKHDYFGSFARALQTADAAKAQVRAGFAYVTLGGVQSLMGEVDNVGQWSQVSKQLLVGVHHGITEPSALEQLRLLPKSEVRLFIPTKTFSIASLVARPLFHPKVIAICDRVGTGTRFLQAGSANLTRFGVGSDATNYEIGIAVEGEGTDGVGAFRMWLAAAWNQARPANEKLIDRYAAIRHQAMQLNPILRVSSEIPETIVTAENFFIEVGAASGPPGHRHQIEFPEGLAQYFGPLAYERRDLVLKCGSQTWPARPLSHKQTTYGVDIWRLGMPTQTTGGEPIAERVVKFKRLPTLAHFEFEVVDVGSPKVARWTKTANAEGHVGATHGQRSRQYGFY